MSDVPQPRLLGDARKVALLAAGVLVGANLFTLISFHAATTEQLEERRNAALARWHEIASAWGSAFPSEVELASARGDLAAIAVVDADGAVRSFYGDLPDRPLRLPELVQGQPVALGPGPATVGRIIVVGSLAAPSALPKLPRGPVLRIEVDARRLVADRRKQRVLAALALVSLAAIAVFTLFLFRQVLDPLNRLLDQARRLDSAAEKSPRIPAAIADGNQGELEYLRRVFDRALTQLERAQLETGLPGDLASLSRTLVASLPSGAMLLDAEGRVLALNPVGGELLGVSDAAMPHDVGSLLSPHPELAVLVAESIHSGQGLRRAEVLLRHGERDIAIGLTLARLRGSATPPGWLALFSDLTEVHAGEKRRRQAESLDQLSAVTAGLAHELRNSLASAKGYLSLIDRDSSLAADELPGLRAEIEHMQRVVEDFLSFARPGSVRLEEVDLLRILHRAAADPELSAATVRIDSDHRPAMVFADPQLLERAFRNLLHNAHRAQASAGATSAIRVDVNRKGDGHRVTIRDQGPGIDPQVGERLFVPFAAGPGGGVGLGLVLCRRIAELHGGSLSLTNQEAGGGAEAMFELPNMAK